MNNKIINKIDDTDPKYIDAIKSCFNREHYQQIIELQSEYDNRLRELSKQLDSSKLKELFVGKYIKIDNEHNFPNIPYNTYAYIKDVSVSDNAMWGLRISLVCAAFDTAFQNNTEELNKIGNFDKNRYIDFRLDNFLDFHIKYVYNEYCNDSLFNCPRALVDNKPDKKNCERNGILTFITAEEFKKVYDEYTEKLFNELITPNKRFADFLL